jgi:hypothetical protein
MSTPRQGIFTPSQDDDLEEHTGAGYGGPPAQPKEVVLAKHDASEPDASDQKDAAPAAPATDLTEAQAVLRQAQQAYEQAGRDAQELGAKLRHAELEMQNAARALEAIEPKVSARELATQFGRTEMARRAEAQRNGGHMPIPDPVTPGPSALDRSRFKGSGGDGRDLAMKMQRHGAARGAFPAAMRGAFVGPRE